MSRARGCPSNDPPPPALPSRALLAQRVPPSLWGLPGLTSLLLNDIGLGRQAPAGPHPPPNAQGLYPLPAEIRSLAGTLRDVSLLQHTCTPQELAALAALTGLTALALAARLRARPTPVPDALSCLTGLAQLRISHGLTQVGWLAGMAGGQPGHHSAAVLSGPAATAAPGAAPASPPPASPPPLSLQVPPAIVGLTGLTLLDLSYNSLHSLKPGPYLKRLVAVNLRANAFTHFPPQLRVARHTAVELQLVRDGRALGAAAAVPGCGGSVAAPRAAPRARLPHAHTVPPCPLPIAPLPPCPLPLLPPALQPQNAAMEITERDLEQLLVGGDGWVGGGAAQPAHVMRAAPPAQSC